MRAKAERFHGVAKAIAQIEVNRVYLQLSSLDFRVIQYVVDQREQRIRGHLRQIQIFALFGIQFGIKNKFRHPHDSIHRRADFMAHVREELALRSVCCFGLVLGPLQICFHFPSIGDVNVDADDLADVPLFIQHGTFRRRKISHRAIGSLDSEFHCRAGFFFQSFFQRAFG